MKRLSMTLLLLVALTVPLSATPQSNCHQQAATAANWYQVGCEAIGGDYWECMMMAIVVYCDLYANCTGGQAAPACGGSSLTEEDRAVIRKFTRPDIRSSSPTDEDRQRLKAVFERLKAEREKKGKQ